jgi:hypothetical protein
LRDLSISDVSNNDIRHAHFARCFMQQTDQLYLVKVLNFAAFECDGESLENFKTLIILRTFNPQELRQQNKDPPTVISDG